MHMNYSPAETYKKFKEKYNAYCETEKKRLNKISWLRIAAFLTLCISVYMYIRTSSQVFTLFPPFLPLSAFIYFIIIYGRIKVKIAHYKNLADINIQSERRINDEWHSFDDDGSEYKDYDHKYTFDLDIFGKGSLFQWINAANTPLGRLRLKDTLSEPEKHIVVIKKRQEAITELSSGIEWRQKFQAYGIAGKTGYRNPENFLEWAEDEKRILKNKKSIYLMRILPVILAMTFILSIIVPAVPISAAVLPLLIQLILLYIYRKRTVSIFRITDLYRDDIKLYYNIIKIAEDENFKSRYLKELQRNYIAGDSTASKAIKKIDTIVDFMNLRFSSIHFVINMISLWDFHCLAAIEKWKTAAGKHLRQWLKTTAELESLSSLALIRHDNPEWAMPELTDDRNFFSARGTGHPLISSKSRVHNDIELKIPGNILIITGSNMSGKSTLLRSVGANLVLAYAGAPACAKSLKCSIMNILTSMRISDNLEKSVSSFYAELIRIRMILDASEEHEPVVFLLDEIFRGTNSKERKIGAVAVLKTLCEHGAAGLVATHDLELAELSSLDEMKFENFFFRETYKDNRISFDYKLRKGVSDTMNAVYLMKMVGIEI